jgi:hypothetical protein
MCPELNQKRAGIQASAMRNAWQELAYISPSHACSQTTAAMAAG